MSYFGDFGYGAFGAYNNGLDLDLGLNSFGADFGYANAFAGLDNAAFAGDFGLAGFAGDFGGLAGAYGAYGAF